MVSAGPHLSVSREHFAFYGIASQAPPNDHGAILPSTSPSNNDLRCRDKAPYLENTGTLESDIPGLHRLCCLLAVPP